MRISNRATRCIILSARTVYRRMAYVLKSDDNRKCANANDRKKTVSKDGCHSKCVYPLFGHQVQEGVN